MPNVATKQLAFGICHKLEEGGIRFGENWIRGRTDDGYGRLVIERPPKRKWGMINLFEKRLEKRKRKKKEEEEEKSTKIRTRANLGRDI